MLENLSRHRCYRISRGRLSTALTFVEQSKEQTWRSTKACKMSFRCGSQSLIKVQRRNWKTVSLLVVLLRYSIILLVDIHSDTLYIIWHFVNDYYAYHINFISRYGCRNLIKNLGVVPNIDLQNETLLMIKMPIESPQKILVMY